MAQFQPGESGNPHGRPKGFKLGRMKALAALDRIIGKKRNINVLEEALEEAFAESPMRFFKEIIMPLLPKNATLEVQSDGIISWKSLIGTGTQPPIEAEATVEDA